MYKYFNTQCGFPVKCNLAVDTGPIKHINQRLVCPLWKNENSNIRQLEQWTAQETIRR